MCGRATLFKPIKVIEDRLQARFDFAELEAMNALPNYNVAPTHRHPVITNEAPETIRLFRWGLIPFWAKDARIGSRLINARSETVLDKSAFRAIHKRRCLVPFDGFYEWKKVEGKKLPYRITLTDEEIFTIAGVWETWKTPEGTLLPTFTLLTQSPNTLVAKLHNRMPAILLPEQERLWLDMDMPAQEALKMIEPFPAERMRAYPVSPRVNRVTENDEALVEAVGNEEL